MCGILPRAGHDGAKAWSLLPGGQVPVVGLQWEGGQGAVRASGTGLMTTELSCGPGGKAGAVH